MKYWFIGQMEDFYYIMLDVINIYELVMPQRNTNKNNNVYCMNQACFYSTGVTGT